MSNDITKLCFTLQDLSRKLITWYKIKYPNREMIVTHTFRTPAEQLTLFVQGRLPDHKGPIVTWKDGFVNKSKHNFEPSRAFDFAIKIDGQVVWSSLVEQGLARDIPQALSELGFTIGFRYGGVFKDWYHIEVI